MKQWTSCFQVKRESHKKIQSDQSRYQVPGTRYALDWSLSGNVCCLPGLQAPGFCSILRSSKRSNLILKPRFSSMMFTVDKSSNVSSCIWYLVPSKTARHNWRPDSDLCNQWGSSKMKLETSEWGSSGLPKTLSSNGMLSLTLYTWLLLNMLPEGLLESGVHPEHSSSKLY